MSNIDGEELKNLVSSTIDNIEAGLKGKNKQYVLSGNIKFEVAVVTVKKGEGGLKLYVVDVSGKKSKESISKITFEVTDKGRQTGGMLVIGHNPNAPK
jgi:predicted transcriptional regulator with HTH domain